MAYMYIFVAPVEDAGDLRKRSLTDNSIDLENVSDFLKCSLPSSPPHTSSSIATPEKLLSSDSSFLDGDSPPTYLDVLPRQLDKSDSQQAPPIPPRKSVSVAHRKTLYVSWKHTHTHTHTPVPFCNVGMCNHGYTLHVHVNLVPHCCCLSCYQIISFQPCWLNLLF